MLVGGRWGGRGVPLRDKEDEAAEQHVRRNESGDLQVEAGHAHAATLLALHRAQRRRAGRAGTLRVVVAPSPAGAAGVSFVQR